MRKQHIQQGCPGRYGLGPGHRFQQRGQQPLEARKRPEGQEETRKKPGRSQEEARKRQEASKSQEARKRAAKRPGGQEKPGS